MGRLRKPTAVRKLEGNPSRRPYPENEPEYAPGVPNRPSSLTAPARKVWNELISEMAPSGVLRVVDAQALSMLCEDMAMLQILRKGFYRRAREVAVFERKKEEIRKSSGSPLIAPRYGDPVEELSRTNEGRRTLSTMAELKQSILLRQREFGLTPASNSRVSASYSPIAAAQRTDDAMELAIQ